MNRGVSKTRRGSWYSRALAMCLVAVVTCTTGRVGGTSPAEDAAAQGRLTVVGKYKVYTEWPFDAAEAGRRQDETAKSLGVPKETALDLGAGVTMKLVLIPPGKFIIGSPNDEKGRSDDEGPQYQITITTPFYIGRYEVTQEQYEQVMGKTYNFSDSKGATNPVERASWKDAMEFCKRLSAKAGQRVRLLTEAEWEYACRAGTRTAYPWGDNPDGGKGWCNAADQTVRKQFPNVKTSFSWDDGYLHTAPVGKFKLNAFGVYDMIGNVEEWCADWYADSYANASITDPIGPASGTVRVLRGGCWFDVPLNCRSANRFRSSPVNRGYGIGFRVAVDLK